MFKLNNKYILIAILNKLTPSLITGLIYKIIDATLLIWVARNISPCTSLHQQLIIYWKLTVNKCSLTLDYLLNILLIQHRCAPKERLKRVKGTRQTQIPLFTKNITSSITSIRGTASPVMTVKRPRYPDCAKVA